MVRQERPGLDLEIDDATQRREFRLQRFAWGVLALTLIAALVGLTGDGPLADARAERAGVELEWPRIVRAKARAELKVRAPATFARDGLLSVRIGRSWLEDAEVESVHPVPERMTVGDEYVEYLFAVADGATAMSAAFSVRLNGMGRRQLTIAVAETPAFRVRQFVFP